MTYPSPHGRRLLLDSGRCAQQGGWRREPGSCGALAGASETSAASSACESGAPRRPETEPPRPELRAEVTSSPWERLRLEARAAERRAAEPSAKLSHVVPFALRWSWSRGRLPWAWWPQAKCKNRGPEAAEARHFKMAYIYIYIHIYIYTYIYIYIYRTPPCPPQGLTCALYYSSRAAN